LLTWVENTIRRSCNATRYILLFYQSSVLSLGRDSSNGTSLGSCPLSGPSGTLSFLLTGSTKTVMEPFESTPWSWNQMCVTLKKCSQSATARMLSVLVRRRSSADWEEPKA
jgi:hypothetical protein